MRQRLDAVRELLADCRLCPRECHVDRTKGELGTCKVGAEPMISSANLHHGEEPPISGKRGSGTIFLTGCNLRCRICQNFPISQLRNGKKLTHAELASKMLNLQSRGAHNINLVTPTHQASAIFASLLIAYQQGLHLPIAYNCGGYESLEMLRLWDGIIDIYMADAKYSDDESANEVSRAPEYVRHNRAALLEMQKQVGILTMDEEGIAEKGLLVRHLVLPHGLAGTKEVMRFVAEEIGRETYIALMSQYFPAWKAVGHNLLSRPVSEEEYNQACEDVDELGLENGWIQPFDEDLEAGC